MAIRTLGTVAALVLAAPLLVLLAVAIDRCEEDR